MRKWKANEHEIQSALWDWIRAHKLEQKYPIYSVPNEHKPDSLGRLKKRGLVSGALDLNIDVPRQGYAGLRIEMKREGGKLSECQETMIAKLIANNYRVAVCHDAEEAIGEVRWYLNI